MNDVRGLAERLREIGYTMNREQDILDYESIINEHVLSDIDKLKFSKRIEVSNDGEVWSKEKIVYIGIRKAFGLNGKWYNYYREIQEPKWRKLNDKESLKQFKDCWFRFKNDKESEFKCITVLGD